MNGADTAVLPSPRDAAAVRRPRLRRAVVLKWLRTAHLYIGLWGAVLGLLFGATGIILNHRAILKIPVEKSVQRTVQMPLPAGTGFATPAELSGWLQRELHFRPEQVVQTKVQPAQKVVWADREVLQPERWNVSLQTPYRGVSAEYFVGNRFVRLDRLDMTPIGTLVRLHMSVGVNAFWVLLSDTIAGSLILLSLSGLLLWTQLRPVRTLGVAVGTGALVAAVFAAWSM